MPPGKFWNDYGYWAFGGDAFTNDWSKAYFLRTLTNFLSDDAQGAVSEHVGTEFASEAAAASSAGRLLWYLRLALSGACERR